MLNNILIETLDNNELNFFNVQSFDFNKDMKCFVIITQNNNIHYIPRESIKQVIL